MSRNPFNDKRVKVQQKDFQKEIKRLHDFFTLFSTKHTRTSINTLKPKKTHGASLVLHLMFSREVKAEKEKIYISANIVETATGQGNFHL